MNASLQATLRKGTVIPACPLALNARRKLDERRQRALLRYYTAAGAGGIAVGVHTTQFAIRDPRHGLLKPILSLAAEEFSRAPALRPLLRIGGICGETSQALAEAELLNELGYHAGLLSLSALRAASELQWIEHCRAVSSIIPIIGFYLQPAVGGRVLPFSFWRRFVELPNVVAIKIAPFNRYGTIDVVRAVAEAEREDIALYTGNDDTIVTDLLTPFRFRIRNNLVERRIVGGLLGHWAVWTQTAVHLLSKCHQAAIKGITPTDLLRVAAEVTDCNAAFFDAANGFGGCIPGLHEVLRRQGLFDGNWCLDPAEKLGPGQKEEIDRVYRMYPHLNDDEFVASHRDTWLG